MLRAKALIGILTALLVPAAIVVHPTIAERWAIYASATGGPPESYPVFLSPFPTKYSCEVEARIIVRNGGHALCRSHIAIERGTQEGDLLWAQFFPSARWIAFCQAQVRGRAPRSRSRS